MDSSGIPSVSEYGENGRSSMSIEHFGSSPLAQSLFLSLKLAALSTFLLSSLSLFLVYALLQCRPFWRRVILSFVYLPLAIPPTVLGFYLLLAFQPQGLLARGMQALLGGSMVFSFQGLVLASLIFSLPFLWSPWLSGLEAIPQNLLESAYVLGKSRWTTFWRVQLPLARHAFGMGVILAFIHTLGEFGVVLMVGGKIPGETRTLSIALYDALESLNYSEAHRYAALLLVTGWLALLVLFFLARQAPRFTLSRTG